MSAADAMTRAEAIDDIRHAFLVAKEAMEDANHNPTLIKRSVARDLLGQYFTAIDKMVAYDEECKLQQLTKGHEE